MTPPPKGAVLIADTTKPAAAYSGKFAPPKGATIIEDPIAPITYGVNVKASQQSLGSPAIDMRDVAVEHASVNDDEKLWLKENKERLTPEEFDHSLGVFSGKDATFLTRGQYFYDEKGIPQQIKTYDHAPAYATINSVWGSQNAAEDDSILTTFAKHAFNGFVGIAKALPTIYNLEADLLGLDQDNFLRLAPEFMQRQLTSLDFKTSSESNKPMATLENNEGQEYNDDPGFKSLAQNWSDIKFNPNAQNIAGSLGGAVGMILQMMLTGGGGKTVKAIEESAANLAVREGMTLAEATAIKTAEQATKKLAERNITMTQKLAPFAKATGVNTLYMLNSSYDSATEAGLTGRERFAVSMISAVGQGIIMTKLFPHLPASAMDRTVQKEISQSAVNAFVKAGGTITPESLKSAFKSTLVATAEKAPVAMSKVPAKVKQVFKTGGAMVLNTAWDNGVMSLDAKLTGRTDDNEYFSPKAFTEYFNSFVSGLALGVVGAPLHKTPQERIENQSKMAYAYIREGREAELLHNLKGLAENGQITPEQHADAIARVNGYKRYAAETKNIKLTDEEREKIFNATFQDEAVNKHIEALEADTAMTPAIREAQIKTLRSESTGYVNEIASILGRKETPAETAKAAEKTGEEFPGTGKEDPLKPGVETPKQRRERIVKPVIESNPGFVHQKHPAQAGMIPKTENLGGAWTIAQERGRGESEMKRWEARKKLKVGDVLTVRRFLPKGAAKFKVQERVNRQGEYDHLLNAFDADGHQVGSIKYGEANDKMIQKLMDEGQDVRIVVTGKTVKTPDGSKDAVEYQIISKPREGQTKDIVRERHFMPASDAVVSPRQVHEAITATGRGMSREALKKPLPKVEQLSDAEIEAMASEIPFEQPSSEESTVSKTEVVEKPVTQEIRATEKSEPAVKEKPAKKKPTTEDQKRKKELIDADPKTFEQAVLQYLVSGQKISYEHLVRNVGKKIARELFMFAKKGGQQTDLLDEAFDTKKFRLDQQQAENALFEVLTSHSGKASMLARLVEIVEEQKSAEDRDTFEALRKVAPEEVAVMEKEIDAIAGDVNTIPVNDALTHLIDTVNPSMKGLDSIQDFIDLVEKNKDQFDKDFFYEENAYAEIIKLLKNEQGNIESKYGERVKAEVARHSEEIAKRINGEEGSERDAGEEISPKDQRIIDAHKEIDSHIEKAQIDYDKAQSEREAFIKKHGYGEGDQVAFDKLVTAKVAAEDRLNQLKKAKDNLLPPPDIKYQTSDIEKEIEKNLSSAREKLKSAKAKVIVKRAELSKGKIADTEDLFGERKSQQEDQLFDERAQGDIEKLLEPQKSAVTKLEAEVEKLKKDLQAAQSDNSQQSLQFQSPNAEKLASTEPEVQRQISEHLAKVFPKVKVFSDPELFQQFLDKNFPGAKLDTAKLGAAIGDAVYINPNRAVQSTQIHEHAHIYWDSLPESDTLKAKIAKLFPNEEAAITAIGQLGTQAAKIKLNGSAKLKFMQWVKEFWASVKSRFGAANKEDLAELFASEVWKNAAKAERGSSILKYITGKLSAVQQKAVNQLQQIADHFIYDPLAHTYTLAADGETQYKPVNDVLKSEAKYAYKGKAGDIAGQRGIQLHSLAEALAKGEDFDTALEKSKLKMTDHAKEQFKSQINKTIETLRGKGELLPETIFANSYYKTAGRPDLPIIGNDGKLHIYDFKTSTGTTKEGSFYEKATETSAAKKEKHGVALAIYSELARHGDAVLGVEPVEVGESGIIPIRLTIGQEGEITHIEVEPIVNVPYEQYATKAKELLQKQRASEVKADTKKIKGAKVMSREKYFKKKGFDEDAMNEKIDSLEAGDPQLEVFREALDEHNREYEKYTKDLQAVKDYVDADFNTYTDHQLADAHDTILSYDNLLHNTKSRSLLGEINSIIQTRLQDGKGGETDMGTPYMQSAYDISERQAAAQKLSGKVNDAKQETETQLADIDRQAKPLFLEVIKEQEKDLSIIAKFGKSFNRGDISKYFKNLFAKKADEDGPAMLKDWKDTTNDLSTAERALLKFMDEKMSPYKKQQILSERGHWDGFFAEVSPNYWEMYHKYGFLKALGAKFRDQQPEEINDVMINVTIDGKSETMRYIDAENTIAEYGKRGAKEKIAASLKLTRAHLDAKRAMDKIPVTQRGGSSRYTLNKSGEMVSKFHWKRTEGTDVSYDPYRSFMSYMTDMVHTEKMNEIMPEIVATRKFYELSKHQPNTKKFMDLWIDGDIFGKEFVGDFGRKVDAVAKFLSGWTYINVMSFNTKVGAFNWTTGKMNQIRSEGFGQLLTGEKRYFANFAKVQGMLKHYTITDDLMKRPVKSAKDFFVAAANLPSSSGENSIRGAAFLSHLTEAEYRSVIDNFDKQGNIIDPSKDLPAARITQLKKQVSDIQGKYSYAEKRMYKHYSIMRSLMMFKGWMPDFVKERFGGEYTDRYLVTHKGAYLSIPYIFRDAKMMVMDRKNWKESKDIDVINNRKNIRELMMYASMLGIYAMVHGESDEEKKRGKLIQTLGWDLAGLMDLSRTKSTIGKPFPALGTVANFFDAVTSLTKFYESDGKFGKEGDWMFPGKLLNVLPYNRVASGVVQEIANPDYNGQ